MNERVQRRLESLASRLDGFAAELRKIAAESTEVRSARSGVRAGHGSALDPTKIERLRSLGRKAANDDLAMRSHKELGGLLRAVGGSSEEAKRSKEHIIDRILYRLFDFSARHAMLKGQKHGDAEPDEAV